MNESFNPNSVTKTNQVPKIGLYAGVVVLAVLIAAGGALYVWSQFASETVENTEPNQVSTDEPAPIEPVPGALSIEEKTTLVTELETAVQSNQSDEVGPETIKQHLIDAAPEPLPDTEREALIQALQDQVNNN